MPISKRLLAQSATLFKKIGVDEDRNTSYSDAVELTNIWLTSSIGVNKPSYGAESGDTMRLTYDVFNSRPLNTKFAEGDKVVFDERDFFVVNVTPVYKNGLTHYIIGLK